LAILREIVQQIGHRLLPGLLLKQTRGPVDPAMKEECRTYEPIAWMAMFSDPERVLLATLRLLNVSERSGFPYGGAIGCASTGAILDFIGFSLLAEGYHHRAVASAEYAQDPRAGAVARMGLGFHKRCLGELQTAIEYFQQGAKISQETGDLHSWGNTYRLLAVCLIEQGNLTQGLLYSRNVVRLGQEGADPQVECWGLSAQGAGLRLLGRLEEAITVLRETVELAETIPDRATLLQAGGSLGRCYLCQGELERALSALKASQQIYVEQRRVAGLSTPLYNGLAEAYLMAVEQSDALEQSESAGWRKKAGRACQDALKRGKTNRPGLPEAMRLQGTYEWLRDKPAAAQRWWQRSLALAEKQGQPYELGTTHLEIGRRLGERAHLEQAEAILAEIGAEWDLARAREALEKRADPHLRN
jgi:tetratricopeptide (TPR) repeat protein